MPSSPGRHPKRPRSPRPSLRHPLPVPFGSPESGPPILLCSSTGKQGRPAGNPSPPAPSRVRCSDAQPGSQLLAATNPGSQARAPATPIPHGTPEPGPGEALTFPHHRLQPRGRHLPRGAPLSPLPGVSQGGGVAPRVTHVDPAPRALIPPPAHLAPPRRRFSPRPRKLSPWRRGQAGASAQPSTKSLEGHTSMTRSQTGVQTHTSWLACEAGSQGNNPSIFPGRV